ncbi:protein FAM3C [Tachysurus vachellii]|uniref:protein FAM3C n=1 Tax=Tachysurus vachellii TaxID=175792 RepID=UPI00296AA9F7|nr:protein FAM3C [Tachysurus vachellii]
MNTGRMRHQELSFAVTFVIIFILVLGFLFKETSQQGRAKYGIGSSASECVSPALFDLGYPGCCPYKVCPADHFSFFLRSGAANAVGPKICFNNRIVMSGGQNNVGWGINIVIVDGKTGSILQSDFFELYSEGLYNVLKTIQKGNIVLVASFADPSVQLTDEVREIFAGMGSSLVYSVKYRDSWVFAGAGGLNKESPFEKLIVNDQKTNAYGDWPEMGELGGCFPRKV